jgi:two-component system, chemotaxis family, protein-glutamate methylesterase/glutaminase
MPKRNIIVMGGSAGSFDSFKTIVSGLPSDLDASIFIVWHMSSNVRGVLPQVLNRLTGVPAVEVQDGEKIESNRIYVARPDHHLLIVDNVIRVTRGPKENRFRPAIDPLFRSAAYAYGNRVIGVVLSGALDDGASGLWTIKQRGGVAVVQDPNDADIPSMPENAIAQVEVDHVLPLSRIAPLLAQMTQQESNGKEVAMDQDIEKRTQLEIKIAAEDNALESGVMDLGELTAFTCPECSGVLTRMKDGGTPRFRCHTGHAFSADSLLSALTENIEDSLWSAIRGIDESIMLLNHLGDHFAERNNPALAAKFFHKAKVAGERNERIRSTVFDHEQLTTESIERSDIAVGSQEAEPSA